MRLIVLRHFRLLLLAALFSGNFPRAARHDVAVRTQVLPIEGHECSSLPFRRGSHAFQEALMMALRTQPRHLARLFYFGAPPNGYTYSGALPPMDWGENFDGKNFGAFNTEDDLRGMYVCVCVCVCVCVFVCVCMSHRRVMCVC
jgi:hypothetical protein